MGDGDAHGGAGGERDPDEPSVVSRPTVPLAIPSTVVPAGDPLHLVASPGPVGPTEGTAGVVPPPHSNGLGRPPRRARGAQRAAWVSAARLPLPRPAEVVVASAAGGVGRTTVALVLAERLAALRAERVAVVDAQARGGTLGLRAGGPPGGGLAGLLEPGTLERVESDRRATAWSQWATVEHASRVSVFGREPFEGPALTAEMYRKVTAGLFGLWPIVVVDTGKAEERDAVQDAVIRLGSVLVVVAAPGAATDAATAAWLRQLPDAGQPRVGVVVPLRTGSVERTAELLATYCPQVVHLGVDKALAADAPLPLLARAKRATHDAATQLAAAVMVATQVRDKER